MFIRLLAYDTACSSAMMMRFYGMSLFLAMAMGHYIYVLSIVK